MSILTKDLSLCAEHIKSGDLVSFPTETVYGLGANALDPSSVQKIFLAKKRPLTDPVIVHISSWAEAESLIDEPDEEIKNLAQLLGTLFWPGPLTLVLRKSSLISTVLTAGTEFVGLRCPNHPIALDLIRRSGCPIAAPSANLFAHVSPTRPAHVMADFHDSDFKILVIDGGFCSFGIESTVAKFERTENSLQLVILRRGGITQPALQSALQEKAQVTIRQNYSGVDVQSEAPGQLLKHYSPNIETYLLTSEQDLQDPQDPQVSFLPTHQELANIQESILIEFGNSSLQGFKSRVSLSETQDVQEAIQNLYDCLRSAEENSGKIIVIKIDSIEGEHASALWDRVFRATSGRLVFSREGKIYLKS